MRCSANTCSVKNHIDFLMLSCKSKKSPPYVYIS
nr:MAG TPA: hypothetical protein [Bacteriophage sp.]